jgi:tetratricopeptide (TPR) repeat protein
MNPNEETLYGNRSQCYKQLSQYKLAIYDLNKALQINPRNTKNIKRLAAINLILGNLGEVDILYQKCVNLEPREYTHSTDLNKVRALLQDYDKLTEAISKEDYQKSEELAKKILKECTEYTEVKKLLIKSLLENVKLDEAYTFLTTKLNRDEKNEDEFEYLTALTLYYQGK